MKSSFKNISDIRKRVEEIAQKVESDASKYVKVVGRRTVIFDFNQLAKDCPKEFERQRKIINRFFKRHKCP